MKIIQHNSCCCVHHGNNFDMLRCDTQGGSAST